MSSSPRCATDRLLLARIATGTASATGEAFFATLVQNLARAMGVHGAWVTEWLPAERRLRALSFWLGAGYYGEYEYDVTGTPCEAVVAERRLCHVPERVVELFPEDTSLVALRAVSYMGVPLDDIDGRLLGHLAVLHDEPLGHDPELESILRIFAARASLELQRLRRDRALAEQQAKLLRLFDGTLDAILELDDELLVTQLNDAAVRLFGRAEGQPFEHHLSPESRGRLHSLLQRLREQPAPRALWVENGLDCVAANGEAFPAEVTLSRFEHEQRPFYSVVLRNVLERVRAEARIERLTRDAQVLQQEVDELQGASELVGSCDEMRRLLFDLKRVADSDATVLITGETGTGKELIARALHRQSRRSSGRLVKVNCAAIPAQLQESEFFGHERGAFTGATQRREGRFKLAHGGTLFLDEVGELPPDLQAKLLRVLQEGEFEPVGSSRSEKVDVRVVAATHRDLSAMVAQGRFRQDLYYRLNVFPLRVPPLRERTEDLAPLADALLERMSRERGYRRKRLGPEARARLLRYDWPGNVRELQNVLERAVIIAGENAVLDLASLLPGPDPGAVAQAAVAQAAVAQAAVATPPAHPAEEPRILTALELEQMERSNMLRALETAGWKISGRGGAAELLGLKPNTLSSRMKALGLSRPAP